MIYYILPVLSVLVIAALIVRRHWLTYRIQDYTFASLYYVWKTKQTTQVTAEMAQLWPYTTMLLELWSWDFTRYIVYQDHYEDMLEFMADEMKLTDAQIWHGFQEEAERHHIEEQDAEKIDSDQ